MILLERRQILPARCRGFKSYLGFQTSLSGEGVSLSGVRHI